LLYAPFMVNRALWLTLGIAVLVSACSPALPPAVVPAQPDATFEPFKTSLQAYVDLTQPFRKIAAQDAERVSGKAEPETGAEQSVRTRQNSLTEALTTKLRPNAKQGDLISPEMGAAIIRVIKAAFDTPKRQLILDELAEQNSTPPSTNTVTINQPLDSPRVPPRLMDILPPLPKQLEYDFVGRTLLIHDVDANIVIDYLPEALPTIAPPAEAAAAATPVPPGAVSPLPMPSIRGGTVFALMGDSGSGDQAQQAVAQAMLTYFNTATHFPFVLMLGDNLYDDDYTNEFAKPYKPLLDLGVKFYATLGNHDRDLEIHYKPFNMGDVDRYSFDQGNARFVVLNTNHPADPLQIQWLDQAWANVGTKWRIAFFHHPLYSSGQHAAETREVIRPALEPALVRNQINVVFSGHEHLYERVMPQRGINYFVSGGGGRYLYNYKASAFDVIGVSEHHFMVAEIAGDRLFFEAITHTQQLLDCGVIYRTYDASLTPDDTTTKWLAGCEAGRMKPRATR
jgi:hypothetical protein